MCSTKCLVAAVAISSLVLAPLPGAQRRASTAVIPSTASNPARQLAAAKSWGYQLQNVDPDTIEAAPYDMIVIDYSRDGSDALALTADDVAKLQVEPDGERRIVLAYLSIGEAETYRYYWKWYWGWFFGALAPGWRGRQNSEWRGNYGVRYWQQDWQNIIFSGTNN